MEALFCTDFGKTPIGWVEHKSEPIDPCDACKYYDDYCGPVDCTCPKDPIIRYVAATVQIHGARVLTKPCETTYSIKIWDLEALKSRCCADLLLETAPVADFTLTATVEACDMEHMYVDQLKQYDAYIENLKETTGTFRAPVARASYLMDFKQRVATLLATTDRAAPVCDNPHVGRRKKGHSHVK